MFISIKRKFSSALLNTLIFLSFILCCYLGMQVLDLYQQYQKAARLQSYLSELEDLIGNTNKLQSGAEGVLDNFQLVKSVMSDSLKIDLKHDK